MPSPTLRSYLTALCASSLAALASCGSGGNSTPAIATLETPSPKVVTRSSVTELLGLTDCAPVGLTITPDTEQLVLLDARHGVFVMQEDRSFRVAISNQELHAAVSSFDFTDIAGIGGNQFALTATGDGFLLDLNNRTVEQHFCYVPGSFINPSVFMQHTDSVAFNRRTGRIIAQPITYLLQNTAIVDSQVGTFPITGGEGDDWHAIENSEFLAGAITCDGNGTLWLARDNVLYTYDLDTDELTMEQSLERFSVGEVTGMVFLGDDLMLLDGSTDEVVCIPDALL